MVSSHYLAKHDSGIIELILNVEEKAFYVHQSNDTCYIIDNFDEEDGLEFTAEGYPRQEIVEIKEIEELFDKENFIVYHRTDSCCKNQHIFLWIPISLLGKQKLQEIHTKNQKSKLK